MSDSQKPASDSDQNDAGGAKPEPTAESNSLEPILIAELPDSELNTEQLEELVNLSHPPIKAPRIKELLETPDPPSRFMIYLSFAFAIFAVACLSVLVMKYLDLRRANRPVVVIEPKVRLENMITEKLGEFRLILKANESPNEGELRVEIAAECSTQEACNYLKEHLPQARDIVIPVLVNTRRQEILDPESKNLVRRRITEQLNSLPLKGKIIQILFTDLTIEEAPES